MSPASIPNPTAPGLRRFAPALVCLALVCLLAVILGRLIPAGHLTNTDELFTAERARELRYSGPWVVWDNFRPVFRKAPLQYWLTAGTLAIRPADPETAVRLPVLIYALGTAALVGALARSVGTGPWAAPLAVGVFVTCPLVLVEGARALLDMGLTLWTALVLLAAQRARTVPTWWLVAGTAAAFGSLQKIPLPAGVLLGIVGLRLLSPDGRAGLRAARGNLCGGLALAAIGTAFWPALQAGFHAMPAGGAFSLDEAGKLLGDSRLGARSPWVIPERLSLRWSWGLFALLAAAVMAFRRIGHWRREPIPPAGEVAVASFGIILAATLIGFRSTRYVLPAVPGLCVLAAVGVSWLWARSWGHRIVGTSLAVALFALGIAPAWHKARALPPAAPEQHPLAVALGGWLRAGETAVLVRDPDDEAEPDGILPEEFYLFYGNLRVPVRSVPRAEWETTWTPPVGGALGVCRAADFDRVRERLPGAEVRIARGAFVLWRTDGKAEGRR